MQLNLELLLERPRDVVWRAYNNNDALKIWQPSLVKIVAVAGKRGEPGSVTRLIYSLEDQSEFELVETILELVTPEKLSVDYDNDHAANTLVHRFEEVGDGQTRWLLEGDVRPKGAARLLPGRVKKIVLGRLEADANRFKEQLELGRL